MLVAQNFMSSPTSIPLFFLKTQCFAVDEKRQLTRSSEDEDSIYDSILYQYQIHLLI